MTDVMIVEDTQAMMMLYDSLVRREGLSTCLAENAHEAILAFAIQRPKVILLDLMLPDRDGLDLMDEFLQQDPHLKIVVITANGSMNKAVEAMRLGAFDFLVKPVGDARLMETVRLAVDRSAELVGDTRTDRDQTLAQTLKEDLAIQKLVGLAYEEIERAVIEATIDRCEGSLPKAAEMLKLAPSTLYRKREAWDK